MINTRKCLLESGVEIQKRLESYTAPKKMGIFRRPRSASLGGTPKKLTKGGKRVAPSPPEDWLPKKGKGGTSPTYAAATRGQTSQKDGEWKLVGRKEKRKKRRRNRFLCLLRRNLKSRRSCGGALQPLDRVTLSGCWRRTVSLTPRS